jgi:hypothetical protein
VSEESRGWRGRDWSNLLTAAFWAAVVGGVFATGAMVRRVWGFMAVQRPAGRLGLLDSLLLDFIAGMFVVLGAGGAALLAVALVRFVWPRKIPEEGDP